ncbi:hypothetical protein FKM82_005649 [Ascaphus truei]
MGAPSRVAGKMAGVLELGKAAALYQRLTELSCPSLRGLYLTDPQSMQDLLCTPSVHRLDILEWMCSRLYPPLQDQLSSLKESQTEVKAKEIAKLCFDLLLCHSDDLDLIKGRVTPHKQLQFIGQLLDIIQSPGNLTNNASADTTSHSADKPLPARVLENEELLKELFSSPSFQSSLNPECRPWPADIKPLLLTDELLQKKTLHSGTENVLSDALEALQKISATLQALKEECVFLCSSVPGGDTVIQTLKLALTDFHQLIAAFTQVYQHEFQEHCSRAAPPMNPAGPLFQSVHQSLSVCSKELEAFAQFTETSEQIVEVVRRRQHCREPWGSNSMMTLYEKIQEVKQNYEAFRGSFQV